MVHIEHPAGAGPVARQLADGAVAAFHSGRVRLRLDNIRDTAGLLQDLGPWAGVVGTAAQSHAHAWEPDRDELLARLLGLNPEEGTPISADAAIRELLPLAREDFSRALESMRVPSSVAEKAKSLLSIKLPVQQWKM